VGYSGWGPGQLEGEMETGSWMTCPATRRHIFNPAKEPWIRAMTEANLSKYVRPDQIPEDPSMN
jgi:putative transcriptional regulator